MGLETVTHIADLNELWPLGSDLKAEGDDHIRNIKKALKTDFPDVAALVTKTAQPYNRVVNGAMQHSQENATATEAAAQAYYPADQWVGLVVTTGTVLTSRQQVTSPRGSLCCIQARITVADTALSNEYAMPFTQKIEGNRIADFQWGTASAKPAVLRFALSAPVGTYTLNLRQGSGNPSFTHPIVVTTANVATEYSVAIPACTIGTWTADTSNQLEVRFVIAASSNFDAPSNDAWLAGSYVSCAGMTNGLATAAAVFRLWDVGLYLDPNNTGVAPPWQTPDYASELAACQRYWNLCTTYFCGNVTATGSYLGFGAIVMPMRVNPSLTGMLIDQGAFPAAVGSLSNVGTGVREARTANATSSGSFASWIKLNARM
jgi:hypothetical protein